jgi:hypothetical protein
MIGTLPTGDYLDYLPQAYQAYGPYVENIRVPCLGTTLCFWSLLVFSRLLITFLLTPLNIPFTLINAMILIHHDNVKSVYQTQSPLCCAYYYCDCLLCCCLSYPIATDGKEEKSGPSWAWSPHDWITWTLRVTSTSEWKRSVHVCAITLGFTFKVNQRWQHVIA